MVPPLPSLFCVDSRGSVRRLLISVRSITFLCYSLRARFAWYTQCHVNGVFGRTVQPSSAHLAGSRHDVQAVHASTATTSVLLSSTHSSITIYYDSAVVVPPRYYDSHNFIVTVGRPMSCVPGYFEVINTHTVGSLTIPRASIKWV